MALSVTVAGPDLTGLIFEAGLIFARLGAVIMLAPAFGEPGIPTRVRLAFALAVTAALYPALSPLLPETPETLAGAVGLLLIELAAGLMIGAAARLLLLAAAVAGQIIAYQTGLSAAQAFDPAQGQQGALPAAFLNLTFILLIFVANLHHGILEAAAASYLLIPPGEAPMLADAAAWAVSLLAEAFLIGVRIAAPLLAFGLVFYLGIGVISRLMPQAQIFFIAMPLSILIGFAIFALSIGAGALVWLSRFEAFTQTLQ